MCFICREFDLLVKWDEFAESHGAQLLNYESDHPQDAVIILFSRALSDRIFQGSDSPEDAVLDAADWQALEGDNPNGVATVSPPRLALLSKAVLFGQAFLPPEDLVLNPTRLVYQFDSVERAIAVVAGFGRQSGEELSFRPTSEFQYLLK